MPKKTKKQKKMDLRSINDKAPEMEHDGTVAVWWLVEPRELKKETKGGFLELVSEFEVAGGSAVNPHRHPTHEFYYVTSGRGIMNVGGVKNLIVPGDLVRIPPNVVHSLKPISKHAAIHCFCFAVAIKGAGKIDYTKN